VIGVLRKCKIRIIPPLAGPYSLVAERRLSEERVIVRAVNSPNSFKNSIRILFETIILQSFKTDYNALFLKDLKLSKLFHFQIKLMKIISKNWANLCLKTSQLYLNFKKKFEWPKTRETKKNWNEIVSHCNSHGTYHKCQRSHTLVLGMRLFLSLTKLPKNEAVQCSK